MEWWKSILYLFGGIGVINGFLVAVLLILSKERKREYKWLGLLIIAICIRIGKSIYYYLTDIPNLSILQIGLSACLFIGPFFYLFVKNSKDGSHPISNLERAILGTLTIAIGGIGIALPYASNSDQWNGWIGPSIYIVWAIFVLLAMISMKDVLSRIYSQSNPLTTKEKRLVSIALGVLFITCTYQFAMWVKGFTYIWGSLIFTAVFYYLMYTEGRILLQGGGRKKAQKNKDFKNGQALLEQIELVMQNQKLHRNPSLKLQDVATATNLSAHQLSKILNDVYPHGFARYVNMKRVDEAKKLIESESNYTLEGIGYESGFNSKSSFFTTFKKLSGQTPSAYKNAHQKTQKFAE